MTPETKREAWILAWHVLAAGALLAFFVVGGSAMRKPLDPSTLADTPELDPLARRPHDLSPLEKFVAQIKGLLQDEEYDYAESTLCGILKTVVDHQMVTPAQRRAIDNIAAAPNRRGGERGGFKRRWERE